MVHIFGKLADFIFPPAEPVRTLRSFSDGALMERYAPQYVHGTTCLMEYRDPAVRAAIKACKFYRHERAAALLASALQRWLSTAPVTYAIVPVPLSSARFRARGCNQVCSVLTRAALQPHVLLANALTRTRDTAPQTSLSNEARAANVAGAFTLSDLTAIGGKHVLLVDDVVTTGATMRAARAALEPHAPASITCLAWAH